MPSKSKTTKSDRKRSESPTVRIKPGTYQPTKADMEREHRFEGDADQVLRRMFQPVRIVRDAEAEK